MPFLAALVILIVIILLSCINVVPQARAYVCLLYTSDAADD